MSSYLVAVVVTWDYQSLESNLVEGSPITKVNILFHEFRDRFNVLALSISSMNSSLFSHSGVGSFRGRGSRPSRLCSSSWTSLDQILWRHLWHQVKPLLIFCVFLPVQVSNMCIQSVPRRHFLFPRYPLSKMDMLSQTDQPGVAMEVWQKKYFKICFSIIWPELGPYVIWDTWSADRPKQYKWGCQVDVLPPKADQCSAQCVHCKVGCPCIQKCSVSYTEASVMEPYHIQLHQDFSLLRRQEDDGEIFMPPYQTQSHLR